jgi:hypothetical protein
MGREKKLSDMLNSMQGDEQTKARLDLHKFFQTRIETVRTRLWTTLTWLAAVQGAALVLIKEAGLRTGPGPDLVLDQPILIFLLSGLGALLAYYMRQVVKGGVEHIQSNQKFSNIAVGLTPQSSAESVFNVMRRLAGIAIAVESVLGLIGILGILDWAGMDIPHIRIAGKT